MRSIELCKEMDKAIAPYKALNLGLSFSEARVACHQPSVAVIYISNNDYEVALPIDVRETKPLKSMIHRRFKSGLSELSRD